jgi:hypothetical protein
MRNRTTLRRYIEHFLRYSASINYKNITLSIMAMSAVELFTRNSNKLIEVAILESVLQLATKGFQGAFDYGLKSASECITLYTSEECNSHAMKAASLNNPLGRSRGLQAVSLEKAEDSFLMIMLCTLIGPVLLLLLLQITLLGTKQLIGNREREQVA